MDSERLEGLIIDYIDGRLTSEQRQAVEEELAKNGQARQLYDQLKEVIGAMTEAAEFEPGDSLHANFIMALEKEKALVVKAPAAKQVFLQPVVLRAAAGFLLVLSGIAIGFWINKNQEREADVAALRKEVEATKQMMMSMLDNSQSASQRMMGATVAFKMEKTDDQIVAALARTMNEDPNTNVRLAALEALAKFNQQAQVRQVLIGSLATQKDPILQIALIRLMVEMKEKESLKELKRISDDAHMLPAVKDEAQAGLIKLS